MDQHFSNIINTFKRLDETKKNSHGHSKKQQAAIAIAKQGMAEGGMHDAEHHEHGPKFTGYWAGTDSDTPGNKMVGGSAEESIEEEIAREYNSYLMEFGANNPTQNTSAGSTGPVDQAKISKELAAISQGVNKAKSAGVLPTNASTTQSSQAIAAGVSDMTKATPPQKKEMGMVAKEFNDFVKAASTTTQGQGALNTVLSQMKKVKMNLGP